MTIASDTYVAVYQCGVTFFGVGLTADEAIEDAAEWLENGEEDDADWLSGAPIIGNMYLVEVTPALAERIREDGGEVKHAEKRVGMSRVFCLPSELED